MENPMIIRSALLAGAAFLALPAAAFAQTSDADDSAVHPAPPPPPSEEDAAAEATGPHADHNEDIIITGFRRNRQDVLAGTSVVSGEELSREMRPTIGETLARQPGVSATSFGPNASRPILRGFQGERIRILTDGIGSLDVSNTSVDHAVAVNPLTAERIEVLRGPSALLFGSSAIGGVVNVIDARIPRRLPNEPVHLAGILTYGSAASERSGNGTADIPIDGHFVVHFDGNYSKTGDMRVGGFLAELRDKMPNSAGRTSDIAAGVAWIDGQNNVGVSINRLDSLYGIPIRFSLDPAVEAEAVRIDLKQTRVDGRAEIDLGDGFLDVVRLRGGWSNYRHSELEETGAIGTTFFNKGYEGRLEFVQSGHQGLGGGFGAQYYHRRLDTVGDEKSLPVNTTDQYGLFALETYSKGIVSAEAGVRYERQRVQAEADPVIGNPDITRTFNAYSGSVGASIGPKSFRVGLNASHAERGPSPEELYVNGPHPGTQAFEIGDPTMAKEKSNGLELTLRGSGEGFNLGASAYHIWFSDYIYEQGTGAVADDLPVFEYRQANARYLGFEIDGSVRVAEIGGLTFNADALADYVKATIRTVGPAPRIPPFRILAGLEAQSDRLTGRVEVERTARQDRLAAVETPTRGFTLVNASLAFKPLKDNEATSITLSANNLLDVDARRHASFLKDYAPLAGRDIRLTAHLSF
jgi:iron complex outermembrane receptor protein